TASLGMLVTGTMSAATGFVSGALLRRARPSRSIAVRTLVAFALMLLPLWLLLSVDDLTGNDPSHYQAKRYIALGAFSAMGFVVGWRSDRLGHVLLAAILATGVAA